ncbi:hypothetical protein J4E05_18950 [Thalassospira sp. NFXS8]|uniref:hypothetical protein n=1 Tax=Thalassospira sp. NFXS8 TaxID=2819093 RepID=UPI0032DFED78
MPAEWGQAKIEILALQEEILAEIEKGISTRQIFETLTAAQRITISRRSFYRRVKLLRAERAAPKTRALVKPQARSLPATNPAHRPNVPQPASSLPTLKEKEQVVFDRLWDGEDAPSDDEEDAQ